MRTRKSQFGFTVVEFVIIVAVLAGIGLVGWLVYHKHHATVSSSTSNSATQSPVASNVSSAPTIKSASDLSKALDTLNQNDPTTANSTDSSQLSSQLSTF